MTVIGLGAWCDYVTEDEYRDRLLSLPPAPVPSWNGPPQPGRWSPLNRDVAKEALENFRRKLTFRVQEFADLDDGRRITLHDERGYSTSGPEDPWQFQTSESIEADVRTTVLPDDDDGEEHPWEWLVELLRAQGVDASVEELKQVPYRVEFSQRLHDKLHSRAPSA